MLALANKDGGAHVDPRLDVIYADLSRNNSLAWEAYAADGSSRPPEDGPELAIMRQIAHELIKTFEAHALLGSVQQYHHPTPSSGLTQSEDSSCG